jgi:hypothetical protein
MEEADSSAALRNDNKKTDDMTTKGQTGLQQKNRRDRNKN